MRVKMVTKGKAAMSAQLATTTGLSLTYCQQADPATTAVLDAPI